MAATVTRIVSQYINASFLRKYVFVQELRENILLTCATLFVSCKFAFTKSEIHLLTEEVKTKM
jgi:hypothetical protein